MDKVSRQIGHAPDSAASVTAAASRSGTAAPSIAASAAWMFSRPMPESRRSAETWPWRARSHSMTAASRASCAARLAWPPSVTSARSGGRKAPTPRPVPGPSTAIGSPGSPPHPRRPAGTGRHASGQAATRTPPRSRSPRAPRAPMPSAAAISAPSTTQSRLVSRARFAETGPATASTAPRGVRPPPCASRKERIASADARVLIELDAMERADAPPASSSSSAKRPLVPPISAMSSGSAMVRDHQHRGDAAGPARPAPRTRARKRGMTMDHVSLTLFAWDDTPSTS